jgi:hypothetical protein
VPLAEVPSYDAKSYEELVDAMAKMKVLDLPDIAKVERDQDQPIAVVMAGLTLAEHLGDDAEAQPNFFLKPDEAQLSVPLFPRPRDPKNPFVIEKEIPLKEVLEAHLSRAALKRGIKGKAVLCGVGAAHLPRSDGVATSMPTVVPVDKDLLRRLYEAGDVARLPSSSRHRRRLSL